jgi:hypothetical protein
MIKNFGLGIAIPISIAWGCLFSFGFSATMLLLNGTPFDWKNFFVVWGIVSFVSAFWYFVLAMIREYHS